MQNLAGDKNCNPIIRGELTQAGIEIIELPARLNLEVPASVIGKLGPFIFHRNWYYWVVARGQVPLAIANEMYATEIGKKDVRVAGHCGCPPPSEWAFPPFDDALAKQLQQLGYESGSVSYGELAKLCNSGQIKGERFVDIYHIDSQEGLNLFVATLRKHNLI